MTTGGAYEAKTHLPKLLARVAKGERITITKHGVPVAMLVPAPGVKDRQSVEEAVEALKAFGRRRKGPPATAEEIKEMIEEGRL
ncbi:MAG: type II toxin-antitoxin system Phd/YefM family antitoxin [Geminicoccaceae bacterium]